LEAEAASFKINLLSQGAVPIIINLLVKLEREREREDTLSLSG